ncbi:prepilin-type N-terminal cleavage/methylation domain-containing protein [Alteromonas sp. ASW11-36]|uniref:Prepilin-type N-terminal cleavage/methylation domain-containing protein n=1 Tax=Alteromonas arenosi TaxID=3055817 RepID=A0ABT7STL4_9ALTE|nr:prepilin-type N-terminal cleavage/methylation domain-containing protein [Alteromonas sp. ASW11-36]MDM7859540.1 prepilin-type N-terminal cleavage/methylation domain-containing protein [Alteromonas sp. ASW11-36]
MKNNNKGFTLIELIIVIVLLGILATIAAPRFIDVSRDAKIAALQGIEAQFVTTIDLVRAKARIEGLRPAAANPGGSQQTAYVIDFGFGSTEVDWRNLCPEARAESGDQLGMLDFINVSSDDITSRITNQYALIGYDVPSSGTPTNQGCYILYDSFGNPECTLQVVTDDC